MRTLAVPARRNIDDPQALRGEERSLLTAQCSGCHIPTLRTGHHEIAALANQTIHPYTDLLLHDMGEELADDRPDFEADGREWRTPPLWGIGLTATVNGIPAYLHDGRARTLMEAIMFHGGEAETAREYVRQLRPATIGTRSWPFCSRCDRSYLRNPNNGHSPPPQPLPTR